MVHFSQQEILGVMVAASFAAGLNVYATLATLGLLARAGTMPLPPALHLIESWPVIAISLALFVLEFFADKIPAFDLIWNALHTFIRIPIAALVAYGAGSHLSPAGQALAAVAGGAIALVAHSSKIAVRAAVTPSPEPLSNIALSTGEDAIAIGLTWFATKHPFIAAGMALVMVVVAVLLVRWMVRAMRSLFRAAGRRWRALEKDPASQF